MEKMAEFYKRETWDNDEKFLSNLYLHHKSRIDGHGLQPWSAWGKVSFLATRATKWSHITDVQFYHERATCLVEIRTM